VLDRPLGGLMDCRLHPSEMVGRRRSYQSVIRRCRWCRWPYRCFLADPEPEAGELLIVAYRLGTAVPCCPLGLLLAFSRPSGAFGAVGDSDAHSGARRCILSPPARNATVRRRGVVLITSSPRYSPSSRRTASAFSLSLSGSLAMSASASAKSRLDRSPWTLSFPVFVFVVQSGVQSCFAAPVGRPTTGLTIWA
jgi:hypothetical protein